MGRPPIGSRAMTNAERQRRYREHVKTAPPPLTMEQKLANAQRTIREQRSEITYLQGEVDRLSRHLHYAISPLQAENNQLRMVAERLLKGTET